MRIAVGQIVELTDDIAAFTKQMGIRDVQFNFFNGSPHLSGNHRWEYMDLVRLRTRVEDAGLRLNAIENVPIKFYDKIMLGLPGREQQIEDMCATISNLGRARIPILGYHFIPTGVWRTSTTTAARGGAKVTSFDYSIAQEAPLSFGRVYGDEELWGHYETFINAILPVAEEAGVTLALHPDDPPVPSLGGVARIMRNFDAFNRAMTIGDSPNHGLDFCVGTWSELDPVECLRGLQHFCSQGKIVYVHFRDVLGTIPNFREAFIGEGNLNMFEVMGTLRKLGFSGFIIDDHVPTMTGDDGWCTKSRAFANGQMTTMLALLETGRFD